ncbi:sphingomyelin phosphodiesterase [Trema orientale]|uniref:Sphingomyelin phosphodiesterase n=1 Tax=Trema orientale TaxID=63057 RepID=A0A2P5FIU5_TREOI|nr:sphingomyelin phosphodiesterase [Trema orientale]
MLPHSYTVDSLSKSQDLAATILGSSAPSQISAACASIDSFLHSHSPDQFRHFFSFAFPTLICKLFGFDDGVSSSPTPQPPPSSSSSSNGWIDTVLASNDPGLADSVFSLLAPGGVLLSSISAVDRLSLVKYVFPNERLPEWARFMLSSDKDCRVLSDLCPIFKGKIKEDSIKGSVYQVQLNVFEYYMFWFAYYPVCRGNNENSDTIAVKRNRRFKLENWVSSISGFSSSRRDSENRIQCNLYVRLLYAYLRAFVPVSGLNSHQPYQSSLLHYSLSYDGSVMMQAEFLVNEFIHFWLVDNDFSPLPVDICKSFGVNFPFRSVLREIPPTAGLGEVVKLIVKYLNLSSAMQADGNESVEHCGSPRWTSASFDGSRSRNVTVASPFVRSVGSWNLSIQRPLYRYILRTFLFCPIGTSIKNPSEVFSVWITYIEPWTISLDDFLDIDAIVDGSAKTLKKEDSQSQACGYSPSWQGYVLSNYLYYSSLVMHFIGFAHKFLHADAEIIVQMVLKVVSMLTSSKELLDLIKMVDSVFHSKQARSGKPMLNSLYRFVPSIHEQLKDWEDGLSETDADGSFLHENWNKDLRLFSGGEDGGQQLLQLFILRAEAELQAISGDNLAQNLQYIDSLKAQVGCLFGNHTVKPLLFSPEPKQHQQARDDIFKPRRVGSHTLADVKYKGDWMKRPISDDEVGWLAKLFVWLSDWLNENLGINQPENGQVGSPSWSYVEVSSDEVDDVSTESMKAVLCAIGSWFLMLGTTVVRLMRKHGLRVNLRILASKKLVMFLFLYAVFSILRKAFGVLHRV